MQILLADYLTVDSITAHCLLIHQCNCRLGGSDELVVSLHTSTNIGSVVVSL